MTVKFLAAGVAAAAAIGVTAGGVTSVASGILFHKPAAPQAQLVVFGAPLPLYPTAAAPTARQLLTVLYGLANPNVPFANKAGLVEGGISPTEAYMADNQMKKAAKKGQLPLSFNVSNIQSAGPATATADVAVYNPKLTSPVTKNIAFVNQGNWMLSRASVMPLLQTVST